MKINETNNGFVVGGVTYKSVPDACRQHGVLPQTYRLRVARGLTPSQALGIEQVIRRGGLIEIEGRVFNGWNEISKHYGVWPEVVRRRYEAGVRGLDLVVRKRANKRVAEPVLRFIAGGVGYKSAAHACRELGMNYQTYMQRMARGLSVEQALGLEPLSASMPSIEIDGVVFDGWRSVAEHYGVTYDMVRRRYLKGKRGMDLVSPRQRKEKVANEPALRFWVAGVGYKSAAHACRELGMNYQTYMKRMARGLSLEQALGLDDYEDGRAKLTRKFEINGSFLTMREMAEKFGISQSTIGERLRHGATVEQSVRPVSGGRVALTVRGVTYESISSAALAHGVKPGLFRTRMDNGFSVEQALGLEIRATTRSVFFRGEMYKSRESLCRHLGIPASMVINRMRKGLSCEDAAEQVLAILGA